MFYRRGILRRNQAAIWPVALLLTVAVISPAQIIAIKYYAVPPVVPPREFRGSSPSAMGIATGPDGALWFTEFDAGKIGRLTTGGVLSEYLLPTANMSPVGITAGPDGALWFTEFNYLVGYNQTGDDNARIGRITTTGAITEYQLPSGPQGVRTPRGITTGPDGALWFAQQGLNRIGRITVTGVFTEYPLPSNFYGSFEITKGPDGALWFTEGLIAGADKIGRITTTGVVTVYTVPTANCIPAGITSGPDGALWFTEPNVFSIGRITTSGDITEYHLFGAGGFGITAGPDGAVWFTEGNGQKIGRITTSGVITESAVQPWGGWGITLGSDGNLWFANLDSIGQVVLKADTTPPAITPHVSGTLGSNGWYRSSVTVNWTVFDPESGIASSSGCNATTLTTDTTGVTLTCSATNGVGLSNSVSITIKIDKTPPTISGMPAPDCLLWPPNHKLVQIADVKAIDALSGLASGSFHVNGVSNEPSDPNQPDVVITQDGSGGFLVQLRADRLGNGNSRIYTLESAVTDNAGNSATATSTCTVPHN